MNFNGNGMTNRFPVVARIGDILLLSAFVFRLLIRLGIVSNETAAKLGVPSTSGGSGVSMSDMALVGAAAIRLVKWIQNRRTG